MVDRILQDLLDRVEIAELGARATRLLNDQDLDAYCECYTEDGEFAAVGLPSARGRAEIKELMKLSPGVIHMTLDLVVEVDGDEATAESNLIATWAAVDKQDSGFLETGRYRDTLVRTPDGWRLKSRRLSLDIAPDKVVERLQAGAGVIDVSAWRAMSIGRWRE